MRAPTSSETYRRPPADRALRWTLARDPALSAARFRAGAPGGAARAAVPRADAGARLRRDAGAGAARAAAARARLHAPQVFPAEGRGAGGWRCWPAARSGSSTRDQRRDDPPPHPARLRGGARGGGRLLRRADPPHGQDAREPRLGGEERSGPGCAKSRGAGSTRSSSTPRAAARRSRTTATCSATTRPWRRTRRGSRGSPATSPRSWRRSGLGTPATPPRLSVAYHAACSLQHGQQIRTAAEGALEGRRLRGGASRATAISAAARPAPTT